ncbi:MAG: hypothetical protein MJZ81_00415 [Bacteroidales bacterium]|nr:hypothetical protein [Bacteroidales bacterium]
MGKYSAFSFELHLLFMEHNSVGIRKTNPPRQPDKPEDPHVFRPIGAIVDAIVLVLLLLAFWIFIDGLFSLKIVLTLVCVLYAVSEFKDLSDMIIIGDEYLILQNIRNNRTGTKEERLEFRWKDILEFEFIRNEVEHKLVIKTRGNRQGYTKQFIRNPFTRKQFSRMRDICTRKARAANPDFRGTRKGH